MPLSHNQPKENCFAPDGDLYIVTLVAVGDDCAQNDPRFVFTVRAHDRKTALDKAMHMFRQTNERVATKVWAWSTEPRCYIESAE
jgi:hypothetical protein